MSDDQASHPNEKVQRALERARRERRSHAINTNPTYPLEVPEARPTIRPEPRAERIVAGLEGVPVSDAFRMLRSQVVQRLREVEGSTLAVTSPRFGEGKTLISCNLAVSLAGLADLRVLLVDLDLRRPAVLKTFGLAPANGVSDHLLRGVPLAECFVDPGIDRLLVLSGGTPSLRSSELLSSARMAKLATELSEGYADRIVLYDLPPVLLLDDAFVFLDHVDACLLVAEQGRTRGEDISRCLELLSKANVIGTVLNKVRDARGTYGYGYGGS